MEVNLTPPPWATHLLSDLTDWERDPLPVGQLRPFSLPDDVYFEYAYQDGDGRKRPDPENPDPGQNPWWPHARSLCGPAYRPGRYAGLSRRPSGQMVRMVVPSRILGQDRRVWLYTPAGLAGERLPLVLCQDGTAFYAYGKLPQLLDVLVEAGVVRAAHLVLVPPVARTAEYALNPAYRRFLCDEVLPAVAERAACDGRRVAMGVSLGGHLSATLASESPELFSTVAVQSGAFLLSPDQAGIDPFSGPEWFLEQVTGGAPMPGRWYLDCGTLEWLRGCNRRLAAALRERGLEVAFHERNAGHNWVNWRNGLAAALRFALGVGNLDGRTSNG